MDVWMFAGYIINLKEVTDEFIRRSQKLEILDLTKTLPITIPLTGIFPKTDKGERKSFVLPECIALDSFYHNNCYNFIRFQPG
jgi:hypothetical protein